MESMIELKLEFAKKPIETFGQGAIEIGIVVAVGDGGEKS